MPSDRDTALRLLMRACMAAAVWPASRGAIARMLAELDTRAAQGDAEPSAAGS